MSVPNCLIIPSMSGAVTNCINVKLPPTSTIIGILIISWIVFMVVAYIIYYFLNQSKNKTTRSYSYWMILLILILAGLVVNFLGNLFLKL